MKAVIQRVSRAIVRVEGQTVGEIGRGLLLLLGIGKTDGPATADWMIDKLLKLRIFPDDAGKMNRSVTDMAGGILVVSQFTLYGVLEKGTRPSFSDAMPPVEAEQSYRDFMSRLRAATTLPVAEGRFAAMMDVELVNDGPVTIVLETPASVVERASRPFAAPPETPTGETPVPLFVPFDPQIPAAIHRRNLPHGEQSGRTYFVTFRLADSLPRERLEQWQCQRDRWLRQNPPPHTEAQRREFHEKFPARFEQWLDAGHGACWLRRPEMAALVEQALRHFHGQRYALGDFVIMPNHVHVLVTPLGDWTLEKILHSWKSFTAHEMNKLLKRDGQVWQEEYFDCLIRNEHKLEDYAAYIHQNQLAVERASRPLAGSASHSPNGRDARSTDSPDA